MEEFIRGLPKCELHMHLCGNTEPDLVFTLARRNNVTIPYESPEALSKAYQFNNLQEFLDAFRAGTSVIKKPEDLYEIAYDYFVRAAADNVRYAELHYNPQFYDQHKVMSFNDAVAGVVKAMDDAEKNLGVRSKLILTQQRYNPEEEAIAVLKSLEACPHKDHFVAVGLASSELPFPPKLFVRCFEQVRKMGLHVVAHAGEEGPAEYVDQALELLHVDRIDHGNRAQEDPVVMQKLIDRRIPLTLCPLSNLRLQVVKDLRDHPLKKFMERGIICTVNSDDPAFFGGYVNANFVEIQRALDLSRDQIIELAKNSFLVSFMSEEEKQRGIAEIDEYVRNFGKE